MFILKRFWPLTFGVALGLAIWAGCETDHGLPPAMPAVILPPDSLRPGPDDPKIALLAARLMEMYHYSQHRLDTEMSMKFFDGYIDSLDPRHEYFLQSDLAEFSKYRTNLDTLTINKTMAADLSPAFLIFQRYQQRLEQHAQYATELLQQDKFKFNLDEKIEIDRRHEPFPKDLEEARLLWRQRVRYEYLQDKLSREISESNGVFTVKLPADANTNIISDLEKHNRWSLHLMTNQDSDNVLQIYLNALAHAYDPHSDYFNFSHAQDFSISMNLALFGIGAQLGEEDGYCTIRSLVPGGPASQSKQLNERDRIVAVAQGSKPPLDVVDMDLEKVVQQIRGPKGTEVRITVSQAPDYTKRKVISLVRDEIKLEDSEAKAKILDLPNDNGGSNRIGILDLPSFYAPVDPMGSGGHATPKYTSEDVTKLLKKMKQEHVSGLIVDLRSNPGGSLEEAIKFTGLFIKGGPVVQARGPDGSISVDSANDSGQVYSGPLVVMINRFSASAAEIAAAALQDYGRAIIVGDVSTHGKGTVQSLMLLHPYMSNATNDPGELKITIKKFYRITGASTQLKGVMPDIVLPDILNYNREIGESNLDNPLPWDQIQPASYEKLNLVQPYVAELEERSDARLLTNQDFIYIRKDIEEYKKNQANRTASLNERETIKDRERETQKVQGIVKEQQSRPDAGIATYDLTVEHAGEKGLPTPKPYLTTNYESGTAVSSLVKLSSVKAPNQAVYVYTNFFTADLVSAFNGYFRTNHPDSAAIEFVYTNSSDTNIIAVYRRRLSATNATSQTFKPVVSRTYMPDPMLDETERILKDYISFLQKSGNLTVYPASKL